jgi:hypothetical protein
MRQLQLVVLVVVVVVVAAVETTMMLLLLRKQLAMVVSLFLLFCLKLYPYYMAAFPKLFSSGDHFYQSECSTDRPTLVPFESKLFKILN